MSIAPIIAALENLVQIHHELVHISEEKTELIKSGRVDAFQKKILAERKLVLSLEQAERKRLEVVEQWFNNHNKSIDEKTITNMLEMIRDEEDKTRLATVTTELTETITNLKRHEQLNRDLLEQSMQFVQMSLNMLSPSIEQMNYGEKKQANQRDRSVFDSKA